ncbi:MAG: hypothetical protein ABIR83_15435 [Nakamurella sp.]
MLCPTADGTPRSEYVEGTDLVTDDAAGVLRILDGDHVVREYTAGAWSTFCEWVNAYSDFLHGSVIRLPTSDPALPSPAGRRSGTDAECVPTGAMRIDAGAALGMLSGTFRGALMPSRSDGVGRGPTRWPGPRHA